MSTEIANIESKSPPWIVPPEPGKNLCPAAHWRTGGIHKWWNRCGEDFRTEQEYPRGSIKTEWLRCPKCKRRVKARISFCHDGCCIYYDLPPHKPKGWWKKRKVKRKERRVPIRRR